MISSALIGDQPSRPNRNARRYSTVCTSGSTLSGSSTSDSKPSLTLQPLTMRITPPVAIMLASSRNGCTTRARLSCCRMQSASTTQNNG